MTHGGHAVLAQTIQGDQSVTEHTKPKNRRLTFVRKLLTQRKYTYRYQAAKPKKLRFLKIGCDTGIEGIPLAPWSLLYLSTRASRGYHSPTQRAAISYYE